MRYGAKMKKIIFVIKNLQGNGAEKFVTTLSKALNEHYQADCHIICLDNKIEHEVDKNTQLHTISVDNSKKYKDICNRIDKYVTDNIGTPDLVLSNLTYSDKIMRYSQLPNVFHIIHSISSIEHYGNKGVLSRLLAKIKLKKIYRNKPSICVSLGSYNDFQKNVHTRKSSYIIFNPIDKDMVNHRAQEKTSLSLPEKYILHVGKFNEAKRQDRLLHAYALIHKYTDHELVLLGQGHTFETCKELANTLGIESRVHFMGHVLNPYPIIKHADLFVLSSDFEGLSYVVLEAVSLGVPSISVDCPSGPREIMGNEYSHCLCAADPKALAETIIAALNQRNYFTPRLQEKFSMKFAADEYIKLIDNHE
jgi:glycosyltransferase involved in cell wall biosynthesis